MLSAQTGLPALTIPLPLSEAALPVGLTLLARTFEEPRLLALGYDWQIVAKPRTPPIETPPLIRDRAPTPREIVVRQDVGQGPAIWVKLRYDVLRGTLDYTARLSKIGDDAPVVLAIQRWNDENAPGPIVELILKHREDRGAGQIVLDSRLQHDLLEGRLYLQLYSSRHPLGLERLKLMPTMAWSAVGASR